jgi:hypothetical protein
VTPADADVEACRPVLAGRRVLLCVGGGIAAYLLNLRNVATGSLLTLVFARGTARPY